MKKVDKEFIELLMKNAPDILVRRDAKIWSNGVFTAGFLECVKPKPKAYYIGGKVAYKKKDFMEWLEEKYGSQESGDGVQGSNDGEEGS